MGALAELKALLGAPVRRSHGTAGWAAAERYVGSALPRDFTAFLDSYGSGVVCGELVVLHPEGSSPLLPRMEATHRMFAARRRAASADGDLEHFPHPFHPEPGGLVSWGYDHSGDEHFFLPCGPDPDRWKVVTMVHEVGCRTFDGPFAEFVLSFVEGLRDVDRYHGLDPEALEFLEPEDLEELVAAGEIGPRKPGFEPF
ncbi:hypothetical protein [Streptomyces sp. NPDC007988]|uniref:hypothetical protein n=1 Tax=Streptomyces sp. NPDC007988 TaxID=3364802 RepID=UPI0036E8CAB4